MNVWDFGPLGTAITPLQRGGFPQRKCILKDICTEIVFMKYKKEIQVITVEEEIHAKNRRVYAEYFVMTICLFQGPN